jgi:hypothetical protein
MIQFSLVIKQIIIKYMIIFIFLIRRMIKRNLKNQGKTEEVYAICSSTLQIILGTTISGFTLIITSMLFPYK